MATEKQTAANRRNAGKSTGPRSAGGKKRTSRNALRHGLSLSLGYSDELRKQLDGRVREIAGECPDPVTLECARIIAEGELELARVRGAKASVIAAFGTLDRRPYTVDGIEGSIKTSDGRADPEVKEALEGFAPAMPLEEPSRSAEAIRRALPELLKLDRYERRAAARRDRAVRDICARTKQ
jgi:hypothetical protein